MRPFRSSKWKWAASPPTWSNWCVRGYRRHSDGPEGRAYVYDPKTKSLALLKLPETANGP